MDNQTDGVIAKRFLKMEMLRRGINAEKLQSLLVEHGYTNIDLCNIISNHE